MSAVVKDKATAFRNELAGTSTNKIVCKSSSHEVAGPKKKHVDYLINLTNDPQVSMVTLADLINDRLRNSNWVVVFKCLIVSHNLMTLGNEKFIQCLATRSSNFILDTFIDKSDLLASEMSLYVRKYAKYLAYMCSGYRVLAMDICRQPKGSNSPFCSMDPPNLLKSAGVVQKQLSLLMEVEMSAGDLTNGVINTAFLMLYKDIIKLYTAYNDVLVNLLEKFFEMRKQFCRDTIETYRKFLIMQEGVQSFLRLAEDIGVDRQSHLNLRQVPEDLLPALEGHISEMEQTKKLPSAEPSPAIKAASEKLAALKDTPSPAATKSPSSPSSLTTQPFPSASEEVLEAQRKRFEELKRQALATRSGSKDSGSSKPVEKSKEVLVDSSEVPTTNATSSKSALDSLFGTNNSFLSAPGPTPQSTSAINNPWGSALLPGSASTNPFTPPAPAPTPLTSSASTPDPWASQAPTAYQEVDLFSEIRGGQPDFDAVFGGNQPPSSYKQSPATSALQANLGEILLPTAVSPLASLKTSEASQSQGLTTDVHSSLVKAAENLSIDLGTTKTGISKKTEHQWKPSGPTVMTGGPNFQKQQIQPKTLPPSSNLPPNKGAPVDWSSGMYAGHFPIHGTAPPPTHPFVPPQPYAVPMQQSVMYPGAPPPMGAWPQQQPPQDPFGSIGTQQASLF